MLEFLGGLSRRFEGEMRAQSPKQKRIRNRMVLHNVFVRIVRLVFRVHDRLTNLCPCIVPFRDVFHLLHCSSSQSYSRVPLQLRHLVLQDISVAGLASIHVNNDLVRILHRTVDIPGLDTLFGEKVEHLLNLGRVTSLATPDRSSLADESKA